MVSQAFTAYTLPTAWLIAAVTGGFVFLLLAFHDWLMG
jgi:hypothetical protein